MDLQKILSHVNARTPIEELPFTWDGQSYISEQFNRWAGSPGFSGWPGDLSTEEETKVMAELLKVGPGESLLDVCCGYGRHDLLLAKEHGIKVTGVDISPGLIATAKRMANEQGLEITYEVRHGRDLPWSACFDHAAITLNSFSLFSDEDAPLVLLGVHRSLRPSGRLFMDLDNRPVNCRYGTSDRSWFTSEGFLGLKEIHFHEARSVEVSRDLGFYDDDVWDFTSFKRLYSKTEIFDLLPAQGFKIDRICGGWDLKPFDERTSEKILVVASKT